MWDFDKLSPHCAMYPNPYSVFGADAAGVQRLAACL
jgi:hypothetical protein